jgi:anti-sigma regulatory factor (Ser/Thr protein kinase)
VRIFRTRRQLGSEEVSAVVGRGAARSRRRLTFVAVVAITTVVAVSVALAFQQYRGAQSNARNDIRSKAVVAAGLVNAAFGGDVSTLQAVASAPAFVDGDRAAIQAYIARLAHSSGWPFNGGMGWVDRSGDVQASTNLPSSTAPPNIRGRAYFRQALATGRPYVSGGIIGRALKKPVVAVAVPTHDAAGRVTGVLAASIQLNSVRNSRSELELGYQGLAIVDRDGHELLSGLAPVSNRALLARMASDGTGVASGIPGLSGAGGHTVAFATAAIPAWRVVIDRSNASLFASARRAFALQLASVLAAALVVLAMIWYAVRRARRDHDLQEQRGRAWNDLTRALGAAETPEAVANAVIESLQAAFPTALAIVVFDDFHETQRTRTSSTVGWQRITSNEPLMEEIARRATSSRQTFPLADVSPLRRGCVDCLPLQEPDSDVVMGGLAIVRPDADDSLEPLEWALLGSASRQAATAFDRTLRGEHEHDLAVGLQRRFLPEALPDVEGVSLEGHYRGGSKGLEIGGDWYGVVRRDDGVLVLSVGDVIGRGIDAAAAMARHRDAFHVHAHETSSPAEILRRMLRHSAGGDLMITVACVALDPFTGELAYSCAGHPPPLLVEPDGVIRLDDAASPPLGVADAQSLQESRRIVSDHATVVVYSDGLIERRGMNIDDGIDTLGAASTDPATSIEDILADVSQALGPPEDDVALLVARLTGEPVPFALEAPADPAMLSLLRRRLRSWLTRRGFPPSESEDVLLAVSEACNNAIEHAYRGDGGQIEIRIVDDGGTLRAAVRDRGSWRDGTSPDDRGRGIAIMQRVMDRAEVVDRDGGGTTVLLELTPR